MNRFPFRRPARPLSKMLPFAWLAASLLACSPPADTTPPKDAGTDAAPEPEAKDPAHCTFEAPKAGATGGPIEAGPVRAGLGSRILPMPIGAPLGGYGARLPALGPGLAADARAKRFTKSFVPSVGMHDAPRAEALAIYAGEERVVLMRVDIPLITENSVFAVESAVAPDGSMRGRILISASHSHAGWAGWQTSLVLMPGVDRPNPYLAERMIAAMAGAAKDALASLESAKIGIATEQAFDPEDVVNRDRRDENDDVLGPDGNTAGQDKDPTAWVMRIDRKDGSLLAAVVDFPIHGTVGEEANPLVSTDAPGAIERALSAKLGAPVLHFQGAAGDVSPAGKTGRAACPDATRCLDMPRLETLGAHAAVLLAPLVNGIETTDTLALEVVTRTFPVRRSTQVHRPDGTVLSYAPTGDIVPDGVIFDESGKVATPIDEFNTEVGAGLCGDSKAGSLSGIPGTYTVGPYSSCLELEGGRGIVFGLFDLDDKSPLPYCDTLRSTSTSIRIDGSSGGPFLLISEPGEATAPFAAYLRSRSPAGPDRTLLVGYAADHVGYLLTAEDWLAGGYECSTNIWGPLEGEIVLEGSLSGANAAWTPEREDPEEGSSRFVDWQFPEAAPMTALVTTDHGTVAPPSPAVYWPDAKEPMGAIPPVTVERATGAARFLWFGGDPAVDLPEVTIEHETSPGMFEPLVTALGREASSRDGVVVITYTPDPLEDPAPSKHIYAAVWQPVPPDPFSFDDALKPYSIPLGKYRFHAKGAALTGSGPVMYDLVSTPFDVTEAKLSPASSATKGGASIDIVAMLGAAPGMRALREGPCDTELPLPGPWEVTVSFGAAPPKVVPVSPDTTGHGAVSLSPAELADAVSIDVRDSHKNGGMLAL